MGQRRRCVCTCSHSCLSWSWDISSVCLCCRVCLSLWALLVHSSLTLWNAVNTQSLTRSCMYEREPGNHTQRDQMTDKTKQNWARYLFLTYPVASVTNIEDSSLERNTITVFKVQCVQVMFEWVMCFTGNIFSTWYQVNDSLKKYVGWRWVIENVFSNHATCLTLLLHACCFACTVLLLHKFGDF